MTQLSKSKKWPDLKRSLVAILRGIKPAECEGIVGTLIEAGFEAIEIPLNSPDPFHSIELAAKLAPDEVWIGAGTVLTINDVEQLDSAGGKLMISPNVDVEVLQRARSKNMVTMPGVFTATEALMAVRHGASGLKFFPATQLGPEGINAIRAVLPPDLEIGAVGGVSEKDFHAYGKLGIRTFGLGSSLYKPGFDSAEVGKRAKATIKVYDQAFIG